MAKENPKDQRPAGAIFREAREAKRLSYEVVHEATKIPIDVLKAIEEGYTIRTMSAFYLKAFKKKYAEYLELKITDVVTDYRPETLPKPIKDDSYEVLQKRLKAIFTRDRQQQIVKIAGVVVVLLLLVKIVGCLRGHPVRSSDQNGEKAATVKAKKSRGNTIPQVEPKPATMAKSVAATPKSATASPAESVPVEDELSKVSAPEEQKVNLVVKARKTCWLRVKVDGNLVFQATLDEGSSEAWRADKEIEISGKNIHGLDFELNGKVLPGLGRSERDTRRVIVTRKGLSVKQ